ncbi:unnamed protein product, partial [Musa textilis]
MWVLVPISVAGSTYRRTASDGREYEPIDPAALQGMVEARARIFGHVLNPSSSEIRSPGGTPSDIKNDDPLVLARKEKGYVYA